MRRTTRLYSHRARVDFAGFHFLMFDSAGAWTIRRRISGAIGATSQHSCWYSKSRRLLQWSFPYLSYTGRFFFSVPIKPGSPSRFCWFSATQTRIKGENIINASFRTANSLSLFRRLLYFAWLFVIWRSAAPSVVRQRELSKAAIDRLKRKKERGESTQIYIFSSIVLQ